SCSVSTSEAPRKPKIDDEIELGRLLDRNFARLRPTTAKEFCHGEPGAMGLPLPAAVRLPCATSRRQVNNWFGATPCRRAPRLTVILGSKVSSTMRTFSGAVQRRRR